MRLFARLKASGRRSRDPDAKARVFTALARLPRLAPENAFREQIACKNSGEPAQFFDVVDFQKFCSSGDPYGFGSSGVSVSYNRCTHCRFIFTTFFDSWTADEFRKFLYNEDYILVDGEYASIRPQRVAAAMAEKLRDCRTARILDYGSGSGVFAERMQGLGFSQAESYDPLLEPRASKGRFRYRNVL